MNEQRQVQPDQKKNGWGDFFKQNYLGMTRISLSNLKLHNLQRTPNPEHVASIKENLTTNVQERNQFPLSVTISRKLQHREEVHLRSLRASDVWIPPNDVEVHIIDGGHRWTAAQEWLQETEGAGNLQADGRDAVNSWVCLVYQAEVGTSKELPFWMIEVNEKKHTRSTTFEERCNVYTRIGYQDARELSTDTLGTNYQVFTHKAMLFWLSRPFLWESLLQFAQHSVFRRMTANIFSSWRPHSISSEFIAFLLRDGIRQADQLVYMLSRHGVAFHVDMLGHWRKSCDAWVDEKPKKKNVDLISNTGYDFEGFRKAITKPAGKKASYWFGDRLVLPLDFQLDNSTGWMSRFIESCAVAAYGLIYMLRDATVKGPIQLHGSLSLWSELLMKCHSDESMSLEDCQYAARRIIRLILRYDWFFSQKGNTAYKAAMTELAKVEPTAWTYLIHWAILLKFDKYGWNEGAWDEIYSHAPETSESPPVHDTTWRLAAPKVPGGPHRMHCPPQNPNFPTPIHLTLAIPENRIAGIPLPSTSLGHQESGDSLEGPLFETDDFFEELELVTSGSGPDRMPSVPKVGRGMGSSRSSDDLAIIQSPPVCTYRDGKGVDVYLDHQNGKIFETYWDNYQVVKQLERPHVPYEIPQPRPINVIAESSSTQAISVLPEGMTDFPSGFDYMNPDSGYGVILEDVNATSASPRLELGESVEANENETIQECTETGEMASQGRENDTTDGDHTTAAMLALLDVIGTYEGQTPEMRPIVARKPSEAAEVDECDISSPLEAGHTEIDMVNEGSYSLASGGGRSPEHNSPPADEDVPTDQVPGDVHPPVDVHSEKRNLRPRKQATTNDTGGTDSDIAWDTAPKSKRRAYKRKRAEKEDPAASPPRKRTKRHVLTEKTLSIGAKRLMVNRLLRKSMQKSEGKAAHKLLNKILRVLKQPSLDEILYLACSFVSTA
ncbi:hypothetical protein CPB86DRAFT_819680 [Serendipita vermifera]|nr:hypothetical protein CPB86DRAFT_819680 [Serendipita vermifera]